MSSTFGTHRLWPYERISIIFFYDTPEFMGDVDLGSTKRFVQTLPRKILVCVFYPTDEGI